MLPRNFPNAFQEFIFCFLEISSLPYSNFPTAFQGFPIYTLEIFLILLCSSYLFVELSQGILGIHRGCLGMFLMLSSTFPLTFQDYYYFFLVFYKFPCSFIGIFPSFPEVTVREQGCLLREAVSNHRPMAPGQSKQRRAGRVAGCVNTTANIRQSQDRKSCPKSMQETQIRIQEHQGAGFERGTSTWSNSVRDISRIRKHPH